MTYGELTNYLEELNLNSRFDCRLQTEPYQELKVIHGKLIQRIQPDKGSKVRLKEEFSDNRSRSWYYADIQDYHDYLEKMKGEEKSITYQKYLGLKATYHHEKVGKTRIIITYSEAMGVSSDKKNQVIDRISSFTYYDKLKVIGTSEGFMIVMTYNDRIDIDFDILKEMVNDISKIIKTHHADIKVNYQDEIIYHRSW